MNSKLRKIAAFLAILLCAAGIFGAGMAFGAGSGEPGTQGDPIVTLSYLESRLAALENTGNAASPVSSGNGSVSGFTKLTLNKNQTLNLSDGGMFIVFSGNGRISGEQGILNLSTGEVFSNGTSAVLYSVFMATDNDCGVTASGNMTIYVFGNHEIL
ncbi:MAG: hypothetical protein K6G45_13215 [Lachnospiraceae bacterium]|nr:hypothetical protein [Lachnospiraceae bacterium]